MFMTYGILPSASHRRPIRRCEFHMSKSLFIGGFSVPLCPPCLCVSTDSRYLESPFEHRVTEDRRHGGFKNTTVITNTEFFY